MNNVERSKTIAQRLRALREAARLSHSKLSDEIKKQFDVEISKASLMNYEVVDENHSKFGKNLGMSIEYACCFAAFFGVSTDYLLGLNEGRSTDPDAEVVIKYTGLSEVAVIALKDATLLSEQVGTTIFDDYISSFAHHLPLYLRPLETNVEPKINEIMQRTNCAPIKLFDELQDIRNKLLLDAFNFSEFNRRVAEHYGIYDMLDKVNNAIDMVIEEAADGKHSED